MVEITINLLKTDEKLIQNVFLESVVKCYKLFTKKAPLKKISKRKQRN